MSTQKIKFFVCEQPYKQEIIGEIIKIQNKTDKKNKPFIKSNESVYLYVKVDESIVYLKDKD